MFSTLCIITAELGYSVQNVSAHTGHAECTRERRGKDSVELRSYASIQASLLVHTTANVHYVLIGVTRKGVLT